MPSDAAPSVRGIARARFKLTLLGYRRREVDEALTAQDLAIEALGARLEEARAASERHAAAVAKQAAELAAKAAQIEEVERVATELSDRVVERERELGEVRDALAEARAANAAELRSLIAIASELEAVRRQARGQATRIRVRALREAAELGERVAELADEPAEARGRLLESLAGAIARIGADDDADAELDAEANGRSRRSLRERFEGLVEVEIGPLADFSQLVGFEDAAGRIGGASQISVRRFTQGRATLEMRLDHPVELLRELEERAPFEFRVRDQRDGRLVLDVDET